MKVWHLGLIVTCALAVALVLLLRAVDARRPKGSDSAQIRTLIAECDKAAVRRDSAAVNRYISNDYKDGFGFHADQARAEVGRVLGSARQVRVYIPLNSEAITLDPDGHHATARFDLQFQTAGGQGGGITFNGPLQLALQKEPVRYFLVFPGEEWRITGAEGYSPDVFE